MTTPLVISSGQEWTPETIEQVLHQVEQIAKDKFGLDVYPNQIEIISYEQMLDAYTTNGMPLFYNHWSFGEQFIKQLEAYKRGHMGLAYEIVINSSPCISYLMEENTLMMQTLVIAHACFGHNYFFKHNYLFKQWTDAESIVDYLLFAKKYIAECEEKHGHNEVELWLDAAHSLQAYGVDKYSRPSTPSAATDEARRKERVAYNQQQLNLIWQTVPHTLEEVEEDEEERFPSEPQENLLYFIEKNAPNMPEWKREILRIVRKISQYFYPQSQTKLMNEGCATYFHYRIIHEMEKAGQIDDGAMIEFYKSHSGVLFQPDFDNKHFSGINPYTLGFAMFKDIERVATNPTEEDRKWFDGQDWVGSGRWLETIKWAVENFKDESFIQQFLSPQVIRDFQMFSLYDDEHDPQLEISGIHDDMGYKTVRSVLSHQYNRGYSIPDIQVFNVDRWGDRSIKLNHYMVNRRPLDNDSAIEVLKYMTFLWGYDVSLDSIDADGEIRSTISIKDGQETIDIFIDQDD